MFRCYSYTIIRERINSRLQKLQLLKQSIKNISVCGVAAYIGSLLVYVCCTNKDPMYAATPPPY